MSKYLVTVSGVTVGLGKGTPTGNAVVPEPVTLIWVQDGKSWPPRVGPAAKETSATCKETTKAMMNTQL